MFLLSHKKLSSVSKNMIYKYNFKIIKAKTNETPHGWLWETGAAKLAPLTPSSDQNKSSISTADSAIAFAVCPHIFCVLLSHPPDYITLQIRSFALYLTCWCWVICLFDTLSCMMVPTSHLGGRRPKVSSFVKWLRSATFYFIIFVQRICSVFNFTGMFNVFLICHLTKHNSTPCILLLRVQFPKCDNEKKRNTRVIFGSYSTLLHCLVAYLVEFILYSGLFRVVKKLSCLLASVFVISENVDVGYNRKNVGSDRKTVGGVILLGYRCTLKLGYVILLGLRCAINLGCVIIDWFSLPCYYNAGI